MDRDLFLFQGETAPLSVPPRRPTPMPAQAIVPWTMPRLWAAGLSWLMAETMPTLPAPINPTTKRRV